MFFRATKVPLDRPNWQDWGARWERRTKLMKHLRTLLEQFDIRYTLPIQPVLVHRPGGGQPSSPSMGGFSRENLGNAGHFGSAIPRAPHTLRAGGEQSFAPRVTGTTPIVTGPI